MVEASVTLHVTIHDEHQLWMAARDNYLQANPTATTEELDGFFGDGRDEDFPYDLSGCLRELFDPGVSPPGIEIQDSSCEVDQ